jgi:hypothetical protein
MSAPSIVRIKLVDFGIGQSEPFSKDNTCRRCMPPRLEALGFE